MPLINDYSSLLFECGLNPHLLEFYPQEEASRDGLSRRDIAFCFLLSRGVIREEAYRVAYSRPGAAPAAAKERAQALLRQPPIHAEITRLVNLEEQPSPTYDAFWLQRTVLEEMLAILRDAKSGTPNRIRAGEILLRHVGMTVTELVRAMGESPKAAKDALSDIERLLTEQNGTPATRKQLTNGEVMDL